MELIFVFWEFFSSRKKEKKLKKKFCQVVTSHICQANWETWQDEVCILKEKNFWAGRLKIFFIFTTKEYFPTNAKRRLVAYITREQMEIIGLLVLVQEDLLIAWLTNNKSHKLLRCLKRFVFCDFMNPQRWKKRQIRQIYLCYFFQLVLIFGICTRHAQYDAGTSAISTGHWWF